MRVKNCIQIPSIQLSHFKGWWLIHKQSAFWRGQQLRTLGERSMATLVVHNNSKLDSAENAYLAEARDPKNS